MAYAATPNIGGLALTAPHKLPDISQPQDVLCCKRGASETFRRRSQRERHIPQILTMGVIWDLDPGSGIWDLDLDLGSGSGIWIRDPGSGIQI